MRKKVMFCVVLLLVMAAIIEFQWFRAFENHYDDVLDTLSFAVAPPVADENWELVLVNTDQPVPKNHKINTVELSNGEHVDERIYEALQNMFDAMRLEGVNPVVASGYRSKADQKRLMKDKIKAFQNEGYRLTEATLKAKEWVAVPGTSEHQLGLGIDINADGVESSGAEVYEWLENHSYKYGFVKRYPEDKIHITGINHEPWHYRYVGVTAATIMASENLCLEEYLKQYP